MADGLSDWWQRSVGLSAHPHLGGSDDRSVRIRKYESDRIGLRIAETDKKSFASVINLGGVYSEIGQRKRVSG